MHQKIINKIEKVRAVNNRNWMNLLRIAVKAAPKETQKVIKEINKCDKIIAALVNKLSKD
jgi:hypothetical protein